MHEIVEIKTFTKKNHNILNMSQLNEIKKLVLLAFRSDFRPEKN